MQYSDYKSSNMVDRYGFNPDYYPTAPPNLYPNPNLSQPPCEFPGRPPRYPGANGSNSCCPPPHHTPGFPPGGWHPPGYPVHPHQPIYPSPPHVSPPGYPHPPLDSGVQIAKGYYWVPTSAARGVPPTAVHGGVDQDGTQIYVGRAFHEGDWVPAKVIPEKDVAYIAYGGKEHAKSEFEVLCEQRFDWVPTSGGNIPPGAVEGGRTADNETLYIGRVYHEGSHTVGKVHPSHGTCYIPFGGEEVGYPSYEILVLRG